MGPLTDLEDLLARLGVHPPGWLGTTVVVLLLLAIAGVVLAPLASLARYGLTVVRWVATRRYGPERRRQRRRGKLATHLDNQLVALELQEDWRDDKYAELEAEVEIERTWRWRRLRRVLPFQRPSLRRARSLSRALAGGSEPLLLLEGDPGAGKSVALRHLARTLARRAARGGNPRRIIPLYLNLKALDVAPGAVSADGIRRFVLDTLTEVNNRDVEEVLDEEFDRGLDEGTWLFLFDSFDEIPDILSAPDARAVIPAYARAIADFLAFTNCRGVVASRDFSSPDTIRFTRCRILPLSRRHQLTLIRRADLEPRVDRAMREGLTRASRDIAAFAGNPMFLGLLCEHMRSAWVFPTSTHTVFEEYLTHRLRRDVERVRSRFGVEVDFVRSGAEEIAYTMTATPRMGLEPARSAILAAVQSYDRVAPAALDKIVDVLEYTKLGRSGTNSRGEATFSFIHRRFQEYFATCLAIEDGTRIGVADLLTEDLWRETAVTLLQVQDADATAPLLAEATERLRAHAAELDAERFRWPPGCRHLLGILSTGLESRPESVTDELRGLVGAIVEPAWDRGHRLDRRRALRYATLAEPALTERLLVEAFATNNRYLRQVAFQTAGRLTTITSPLRTQIRRILLERSTYLLPTVQAEVRRLRRPAEFLSLAGLLRLATPVAVLLPPSLCVVWVAALAPEAFANGPARSDPATAATAVTIFALVPTLMGNSVLAIQLPVRSLSGPTLPGAARAWAVVPVVLNLLVCVLVVVAAGVGWFEPPLPEPVLLVLCGYAAVLPPAVVWAALGDRPARAVLLPVLPVLFLVDALRGRLRAPDPAPVARPAPPQWRVDRRELVEATGVVLLAVPPVVTLAGLALLTGNLIAAVIVTAALVGAVVGIVGIVRARSLRRAADSAATAGDVLDVLALARGAEEFTKAVDRFADLRLTRDPAVRAAVENLVGEVERAKLGRPGEPVWAACPSLAARPVERSPLLVSYPLRWLATFHVRDFPESTLDDLARLAEQE